MTLLSIEHLSLAMPEVARRPLLDDVTLAVERGELVGLVGESGSGKSVTARAVIGLIPKRAEVEGSVRVNGTQVLGAPSAALRALRSGSVSMVFQDPRAGINPVRTVGDFMTEALVRNRGISGKQARERCVDLLEAVGLPDAQRHMAQHPHQLSGGMLQRVMIASALTTEPDLLLCDEPTTALDVTTQAEIVAILTRLQRERGLGVLFITHDLDLAAAICERTYVMYAGRVVEHARSDALFRGPRHPYTAGLLASTPGVDGVVGRLVPVPGTPLGLDTVPTGCSFQARCAFADPDRCSATAPPLVDHSPAGDAPHEDACLRSEELARDLARMGQAHVHGRGDA